MTKPKMSKQQREFPNEYEQGQTARSNSIAREDAPYGDGEQLEAWLAGYDDDSDPDGSKARDRTMNPPEPVKATGQTGTVSKAKGG